MWNLNSEPKRAAWGWISIERFGQDLRYAVRTLRRRPAFTFAAVISLALGIGANTAIFSLLNALLMKRLPVDRPGELVQMVEERRAKGDYVNAFAYPVYDRLRRETRLLSNAVAMSQHFARPLEIERNGEKHHARGYRDAVDNLVNHLINGGTPGVVELTEEELAVQAALTWGLQITRVHQSRFSGKGIRVAVLDTGLDSRYPDSPADRSPARRSFLGSRSREWPRNPRHWNGMRRGTIQTVRRESSGLFSHPANCPSIMAVGAIDSGLRIANFSNRGSNPQGGRVDIVGPGVNVHSTWPMPQRYRTISGTSRATPHATGIAALFAEAGSRCSRRSARASAVDPRPADSDSVDRRRLGSRSGAVINRKTACWRARLRIGVTCLQQHTEP